jgi:phosphohistidine phosphatase
MTKTLVIVRHGKSTWDYAGITDFDRPLKETGINNTITLSAKLKEKNILPDLILSSPANRALHTAMIISRELKYTYSNIDIVPNLYNNSEEEVNDFIKETADSVNSLFIFGHNPTFTFLSNLYLSNKIDNLPTSGAVILTFNSLTWNEISPRNKTNEIIIFPK